MALDSTRHTHTQDTVECMYLCRKDRTGLTGWLAGMPNELDFEKRVCVSVGVSACQLFGSCLTSPALSPYQPNGAKETRSPLSVPNELNNTRTN